jgi:hypothetical protein
VKSEEVLVQHRVKEKRNIVHKIKQRKRKWNGHMLLTYFHLKRVFIEKCKGRNNEEEDVRQLLAHLTDKKNILEFETRSTISHFVQHSLRRGYGPVPQHAI